MVIRRDQPFDGACYHIVLRGNNRMYIFEEPTDKQYFKILLHRYKQKGFFELFHYCLMDNHIHLAIRLIQSNKFAKGMQGLCQSYTNHWKRTRGFAGCLWQAPYRRFLIESSTYLLECGRYIERNPVRAGMVSYPADYGWSSYRAYAQGVKDDLVDINPEFLGLSDEPEIRRKLYSSYVESARPYESFLDAALNKHTLRKISHWQLSQNTEPRPRS